MILSDEINDNRLWADLWDSYTEIQKLEALRQTIFEIINHIRATDCISYDDVRKDIDGYLKTKLEKLKIC